jgi:hypothetical protein
MDPEYFKFVSDVWNYKPSIIILLVGGFIIFVLSIIDTHRHRKHRNKRRHAGHHHGRHG